MTDQSDFIEDITSSMTLEEKVSLMAGATNWTTNPVERIDIPAVKVTDGPNGARGAVSVGGVRAVCFPVGIALASSWNRALVERVGIALGQETKTKGASILLAPTVNIHRSPLNGRNFECYSEDPYLTSQMAVAYITGLQSQNVGATVKHFVCNDSEFERRTISSDVDMRTLREIYMPPFEAAVNEAGTWAVMSSYNKVNGVYASENELVLKKILKEEWGFDGIVMSDWGGTYSTVDAANNGLDLEMPGPTYWRGEKLMQALKDGRVSEDAINEAVRRLMLTIERAGAFQDPIFPEERSVNLPEHRALARQAAAEGIVLLKNSGDLLPLNAGRLDRIAIIGPNAKYAQIMGGGSSRVNPHYAVSPWEGILAKVGETIEVSYQIGCTNHNMLPRMDVRNLTPNNGGGYGWSVAYFNGSDMGGEVIANGEVKSTEHTWFGDFAPGVDPGEFSARLYATFSPSESGRTYISLASSGSSRLYIDGKLVIDNWGEQGDFVAGKQRRELTAVIELEAGKSYDLILEYSSRGGSSSGSFRLGCMPAVPEDSIQQAVQLAKGANVALVFVGLNNEWESEGFDRPHMDLIGDQNALVEAVASANPNTVVILQSGSPVSMPWKDHVAGLMQAWYPGQECGNAIADVLFGDANPSGRLPQTFPERLEDNPAFINYPGENGKVRYGEGIFVGYRYYDKKKIKPLFPFGYGLSYTSFAFKKLRLSSAIFDPQQGFEVFVDVTNTGGRAGQEVVQLYLHDKSSRLVRPEKELKAFAKLNLQPGETQTITLELDLRSLAYYDDALAAWVAESGEFEVRVGSSSADIHLRDTFFLEDTVVIGDRSVESPRLSIDSTVNELLEDEIASAILEKHLPGFKHHPQLELAMSFSLKQIAAIAPEEFPSEKLNVIAADLEIAFPTKGSSG